MRGESAARPGKRPLRALSASEKMDAIQRVHEGESKASVARDIGVPESTLRGWCKSEHKIRGMARNSCTPDSEAHSPASSSVNANNSSLAGNSEDEGCTAKRQKTDADGGSPTEQLGAGKLEGGQSKIDYAALMASVAAIRPEGSGSLLLQQLGLLSTATNAIGKNLLHVPSGGGTQSSPVVGLVENGLQYTRSAGITKRQQQQQQQQQQSTSAAAPSQLDTVDKSGSRNSLPPAAEAPFAPAPASPRKTNDDSEHPGKAKKSSDSKNCSKAGGGGGVGGSGAGADAAAGTGTVNNKVDEALWLWLTQQQQLLGQQSAIFSPGGSRDLGGSWFWKWYKQYGFAPTAPTPAAAVKKSPTKTRALLDNVLGNNNTINSNNNTNIDEREEEVGDDDDEENVKRNTQGQQSNGETGDAQLTTEEAVAHGEKFLKWLEKCSQPSVSRMQIMQFRYLLNNLKTCRKPTSTFKRSRK